MDGGVEKEAFRGWDSTVRGTLQLGWELRSLYDMLQHVWLLCAVQEGQGGAALCRGWGVWFGTLAKRLCLRRCWGRAALELNPVDSRELHALRELRYSSWFFVLLSGMGGKSLERSSKLASLDFPPLNLSKTCWPPHSNSPLNSSPPPCDEAHWGLRPPLPMVKFVGSICMNTNPKI